MENTIPKTISAERHSPLPFLQKCSNLIVLPHSVFALPFALSALLLAEVRTKKEFPSHEARWLATLLLVVMAVILARTAAMAFNRLVDANIDTLNPRTKDRELPTKALSQKAVVLLVLGSSLGFLLVSALLGRHCLKLAPFVLLLLLGYSYTKRFTKYSHLVLGLALAAAPGGAWWVIRPHVELTPLLLMGSVMFWVGGFDILYSSQDVAFDRAHNIFSIPAKCGTDTALTIAKLFHGMAFIGFLLVGMSARLGRWYFLGMLFLGTLLIGQHRLLSPLDLRRVNSVFFTFNGLVSLGYFLLVWLVVK